MKFFLVSIEANITTYENPAPLPTHISFSLAASTGAVGVSAAASTIAVGAVTSALALGGVIFVAAVGIAGFITAVKISKSHGNRSEDEVRTDVVNSLLSTLTSIKPNDLFLDALKPCRKIRDYVFSTLVMSLLGTVTSSNLISRYQDDIRPDYQHLCQYIYMREELTEVVSSLSDILVSF